MSEPTQELPVLMGFNRTTLRLTDAETQNVLKKVVLAWGRCFSLNLAIQGRHPGPASLPFPGESMVQSVHFLYEDPDMMSHERDCQLFKLVYPKASLDDRLERMR